MRPLAVRRFVEYLDAEPHAEHRHRPAAHRGRVDSLAAHTVPAIIVDRGNDNVRAPRPGRPTERTFHLGDHRSPVGAVLAALLSACIAVWAARRKSREEERARQRDLFASAFKAYAAYKELPYAIRRRRHPSRRR